MCLRQKRCDTINSKLICARYTAIEVLFFYLLAMRSGIWIFIKILFTGLVCWLHRRLKLDFFFFIFSEFSHHLTPILGSFMTLQNIFFPFRYWKDGQHKSNHMCCCMCICCWYRMAVLIHIINTLFSRI